jgi:hypothetical protein
MDEYKSIKVPLWVYQEVVTLQAELVLHGTKLLPRGAKLHEDEDRPGLGVIIGVAVRSLRQRFAEKVGFEDARRELYERVATRKRACR